MTAGQPELFARATRGMSGAALLVSTDGEILAGNAAAEAWLAGSRALWDVFEPSPDARAYVDACARTLDPIPGTLHRHDEAFRCTGWRLWRNDPFVVLHLVPAAEAQRFALLTQKIAELDAEVLHRRAAERALQALQSVTAALSAAHTAADIVSIVLPTASEAFGATHSILFLRGNEHVHLVGARGYDDATVRAYETFPLDARLPASDVIRTGRLLVLGPVEQHRDYYLDASNPAWIVVLPLRTGSGVIGALRFGFARARAFAGSELARMAAFADLCAQALERAALYETATADSRRKDVLLAILGHELRYPIAPLQTAVELMRVRRPDAFPRQTQHLASLVEDVLEVSRIERGKVELQREVRPLRETVQRAIEIVAPLLKRQRHELAIEVPDDIALDADHARIAQLVTNLLDNASKYCDPGGHIVVRAAATATGVELRVRDDGRGIARDLLPRVCEPFVQSVRTSAHAPQGLGLGLAIVRGIVDLHGGRVELHSEGSGRGTEVIVVLPGLVETRRASRIAR